MNLFRRIFKMGAAEAHSALDKLEDPIKLTEQGIRDLKKDLHDSLQALAEVKAAELRLRKQSEQEQTRAGDWERKAMMLLDRVKKGDLEAAEGENLAREALARKEEAAKVALRSAQDLQNQGQMVRKLEAAVSKLKTGIQTAENDLTTLRARAKTAKASRKINQQLSQLDGNSTISMLERMKERVEEEETLALAYEDMADTTQSTEDKIDAALSGTASLTGEGQKALPGGDALEDLKKKMGL